MMEWIDPLNSNPSYDYDKVFYENQQDGSLGSARQVVPFLMELLHPESVVDVGCGVGTWLSVWQEAGVKQFLGVDGSWVQTGMLKIPTENFQTANLNLPIRLDHRFGLAMSLEVGEHLPENCAKEFVNSLCLLSDMVLFGAAIPGQGGYGHINEQWQDYWKELFSANGYKPIDILRPRYWRNEQVKWWYSQNTFLYVKEASISKYSTLIQYVREDVQGPIAMVHPELFSRLSAELKVQTNAPTTLGEAIRKLPDLVFKSMLSRIRKTK